jgi:hypothetical protein
MSIKPNSKLAMPTRRDGTYRKQRKRMEKEAHTEVIGKPDLDSTLCDSLQFLIDSIILKYLHDDNKSERDIESALNKDEEPDENIEDYISEESQEEITRLFTKENLSISESEELNFHYQLSLDQEEDYSIYYDLESLQEQEPDESRLDLQYVLQQEDILDPDELVVVFWQRYIARLPRYLQYMEYDGF